MNQIKIECKSVFRTENAEQSKEEKSALFTKKWVEFINRKERREQ